MNHGRAGQIYVTSFGNPNGALGKYDTSAGGSPVAGWSNLTVPSPTALAVDDAGFVYLASLNNNTIRKYTSTGTQVNGWEITGLAGPQGITINNSTGRLYVAQGTSGLVASYNLSNAALVNSNLLGSAIGNPYSVLVNSAGFVYVTAQSTGIIYKVDGTSGTTAAGWTNPTSFNSPTGLALDSSGNLYVASYNGGFVSKFDGTSGSSLTFTSPQWNGSFMPGPQGLAIDGDDNLYVAFGSSGDAVGKYSLADSLPVPGWNYPTGLANGVQLAVVPEPSTCAMALAGIACGGFSMWRRRKRA
jgi:DNA-binding beta-propeller fold protein YncE